MSLKQLKKPIDLCLGCRACETVCPTNVPYGTILEAAKYVLATNEKRYQSKSIS
ncbi:4Fe-4S binding protein [Anaerobacillus sp. HL2]|nr:4Fe-4S binding protein [Anaerobacillus sp. HL2]